MNQNKNQDEENPETEPNPSPLELQDERLGYTSASNAEADSLCAGRHIAQREIDEPEDDSEDAAFGRKVHAALETSDLTGLTSDMMDAYHECREMELAALRKYFGTAGQHMRPAIREHRLWIDVPPFRHSGRLDMFYRLKEKALIVEYKALRGEVKASPANMQLRDQVALLFYNVPLLSQVAATVAQPPFNHDPVITTYDALDIARAMADLQNRVRASNDPNSKRTAGAVQCHFCLAKPGCHEYAAWVDSQVNVLEIVPSIPKAPIHWTVEDWNKFLTAAPLAAQWIDDMKDIARELLKQHPGAIPGWRLQKTGAIETVTDPQELFARFEKLGGKLPDYMACLSVGKGKFKDALAATTGASGKALENALDALMHGIISVKEKAPSIKKVK